MIELNAGSVLKVISPLVHNRPMGACFYLGVPVNLDSTVAYDV